MRAVRYHEYGGVEVLVVEQAPAPRPGPGEIRVRVAAAGVNPVDWNVRSGAVREMLPVDLPAIPGLDAVGVVDEIGEGVRGVGTGDRVFGLVGKGVRGAAGTGGVSGRGGVTGATAELAVLSAWAHAPTTWTDEEAAGAGLASVTAMGGLKALGPLRGRTLLVEGAAGGVGSAAVEIAVAQGATVIGTASERNHEFLASLGAVPTTYGAGLAERLAVLAPDGVDIVLDTAGSGSLADLIAIAGDPARVSTIADYANAQRLGVHLAIAEYDSTLLSEASELGRRGRYTPRIELAYPLERIAEAHAYAERGHTRGKIVVRI
ncbi:NADP-dependent oxidoreductase [Nocardiopsis ansamitocini]|uniref:Oxidoreductase n=1 Tax=Nocardiopsis ansamitocini TaxID=1670832 RepID=A0A9W6UHD3_9ACTN|nr:NADP-dependent oxidoreductase [Nocardiopsis ansamitocini]GLU45860.1 oxidoreductase [Nocardiopsis ansamitocini]